MKTITEFVIALKSLFRPSDIGIYFVPMFRPMVREQDRLHPSRVVLPPTNPSSVGARGLPHEHPHQL